MKILYLAHRIPFPPNKGDKIRSFNHLRHLSERHEVHLACLIDEEKDLEYIPKLEEYCKSVNAVLVKKSAVLLSTTRALLSGQPLSVAAFYSPVLRDKIDKLITSIEFDVILLFSAAMAEYVLHVERIPKLMDFVDVDSDKWRIYAQYHRVPWSWLYRMEAHRLSRYENIVARQCQHSIFVSRKEAEIFQERNVNDAVSVIPNGVDLEYFQPSESPPLADNYNIVFTGAMDYTPNIDAVLYFCGRIFPLIRNSVPDSRFFIIGRNPPRKVRELGSDQNVIVTGTVEDVRPYIMQAKVAIAPLRIARGIQNKVIEAMAMGLPVVGTSNAFQGILATVEDGVAITDDPATFAKEVIDLLRADEEWEVRSGRVREYVRRNHVWRTHNARLETLLERLAFEEKDKGLAASLH